jgi:hypothetical protein
MPMTAHRMTPGLPDWFGIDRQRLHSGYVTKSGADTAVEVGAAVAKAACALWLGSPTPLLQAGFTLSDLLASRIQDRLDRRKVERVFDEAADLVAKKLITFREVEFRGLPENEWNAALIAVSDTFTNAQLSTRSVIDANLDARTLEKNLEYSREVILRDALLSEAAERIYSLVLHRACFYLVDIVTSLPTFQPEAFTELLRRSSSTLWKLEMLLERVPERRHLDDFEADYRSHTVRRLDRMELFGTSVAQGNRTYSLRDAFVGLSVGASHTERTEATTKRKRSRSRRSPITTSHAVGTGQPVEDALAGSKRVLLLGEAGAGKTTLLRWIAVRSAIGDFGRPLDGWNDCIPFFLPLRLYAGGEMPATNDFIAHCAGRTIADEMPSGWVQKQFRAGRALILIDGVDELRSEEERQNSQKWIDELIASFPDSRYIVTSRPSAIRPDWLAASDFMTCVLQPMSATRARALIRRWHETIGQDIVDDVGILQLERDESSLLAAIDSDRHIRELSINPLLCALLCALNRDRRGHLPTERLGIYRAALDMLLERRDQERGVSSRQYMTGTSRTILLQEFAFWLVRNGLTEAPTAQAQDQIAKTLRSLPNVTEEASAVLTDLLVQSGLLREAVPGTIDFIHRTFQEYLAGKAAAEGNEIGLLVNSASNVQWHEVIIMAAGLAQPWQRTELLRGLLSYRTRPSTRAPIPPADSTPKLLALACMQTAPQLDPDLQKEIELAARALIPPADLRTADSLGAAGRFVLDLLADCTPSTAAKRAAVIRTVALIGDPDGLDLIARVATAEDVVGVELVRAWRHFDLERYAHEVLNHSVLADVGIRLDELELIRGVRHFERCPALDISLGISNEELQRNDYYYSEEMSNVLSSLAYHPGLCAFRLRQCPPGVRFDVLERIPKLSDVRLSWSGVRSPSLAPIARLTHLRSLHLEGDLALETLPLSSSLKSLVLDGASMADLAALPVAGSSLVKLELRNCRLRSLRGIEKWPQLQTITIARCNYLSNISFINDVTALKDISIDGNPVATIQSRTSVGNW